MSDKLPSHTRRLLAHYEGIDELPANSPEFLLARLFEEGDGSDLRWLTGIYPETRLSTWFDRYGERQLSRRSRSFWTLVLDRSASTPFSAREPLWPL